MFDFFRSEGNDPDLMDRLIFFFNNGEICAAVSLDIHAEIPSGPLAFTISRVIKSSVISDCAQDLIRVVISKRFVKAVCGFQRRL